MTVNGFTTVATATAETKTCTDLPAVSYAPTRYSCELQNFKAIATEDFKEKATRNFKAHVCAPTTALRSQPALASTLLDGVVPRNMV